MPHVELSLVDQRRLPQHRPSAGGYLIPPDSCQTDQGHAGLARHRQQVPAVDSLGSLQRWAAAVVGAQEPCLVIDSDSVIVAASSACAELLCCDTVAACGQRLRDAVLHLVDFADPPDKLDSAEADKIPPLLAISSGRLARGLIRVAGPGQRASIVDAVATPLRDGATVVGSLTFFARI